MLVKYLRTLDNKPFAVLVSTAAGKVGYAFLNPKDTFSKKRALEIATGRSNYYHEVDDGVRPNCTPIGALRRIPDYEVWAARKIPSGIECELISQRTLFATEMDNMLARSEEYFRPKAEVN